MAVFAHTLAALALLMALAPDALAQGADLFAFDQFTGEFITFSEDDPTDVTVVGTAPMGINFVAGDFRGDDLSTWYGLDGNGDLFAVDPKNGAATNLGNVPELGGGILGFGWNDDAGVFNALTNECLPFTPTRLFTVDVEPMPQANLVGTNMDFLCADGLAATGGGTGLGFDLQTRNVYTVDLNTGGATLLGNSGLNANVPVSMDQNDDTGEVKLCAFNNDTGRSELYSLNENTGLAMLLGPIGAFVRSVSACSSMSTSGSECGIKLLSSDLSYDAGTRRLTVEVTVRNNGGGPLYALLGLQYDGPGSVSGSRVLGRGRIPGGATITRTLSLRVPPGAPPGDYDLSLQLFDSTGNLCGSHDETVSIMAPRQGGVPIADATAGNGGLLEPAEGDLFAVDAATGATAEAAVAPATVVPNPFAQATTITFEVVEAGDVRLTIYDVLGREVAVLVDSRVEAGTHRAVLDSAGLAAGTYVWRLAVGGAVRSGRMTLAR